MEMRTGEAQVPQASFDATVEAKEDNGEKGNFTPVGTGPGGRIHREEQASCGTCTEQK